MASSSLLHLSSPSRSWRVPTSREELPDLHSKLWPSRPLNEEPQPEAPKQVETGEYSGSGEVSFSVGGIDGNHLKTKRQRPPPPRARKPSAAKRTSSRRVTMDPVDQMDVFQEILKDRSGKEGEEKVDGKVAFERLAAEYRERLSGEDSFLNESGTFLLNLDEHEYNRSFSNTSY